MWPPARVAELVDAMDSKSIACKGVRVRIPPRALTIRAATPADARAIAEVHVASWRVGYRGLVPDEVLAAHSVEKRTEQWEELLEDERNTVLVADERRRLHRVRARHARDPGAVRRPGAVPDAGSDRRC